jgi:hypothetical protein
MTIQNKKPEAVAAKNHIAVNSSSLTKTTHLKMASYAKTCSEKKDVLSNKGTLNK